MAIEDAQSAPLLRIGLLGQMRLVVDGQPWKLIRARQTLPVLAYLLVHRAESVARESLAFTLWPDDDEESALANLRRYLYQLQKALPCAATVPWLLVDSETARWNPAAPYCLDIDDFERCCSDDANLGKAAELYTGDLLENVYDDWVVRERERLRGRCRETLDALVVQCRDRREHARAIAYAQRLLALDPWREDVVRQLMSLHYDSGNGAGALAAYERFSQELRAEMNVDPMPETAVLRDLIARNAPLPTVPTIQYLASKRPEEREIFPFVGRAEEAEQLRTLWHQAARGYGGLVLITGEAGIGKSRLTAETARRVESDGGRVLWGATTYPEQTPYQCLSEALRSSLPLLAATDIAPIWLAVLAKLLPELPARRLDLPFLPAVDPDREQLRLFEGLAVSLTALAKPRPVLLVLEDLHWAGAATVAALRFLARRALATRVLIVGTYRDEEVPRVHPMREVRRDLQGEAGFTGLSLCGLQPHAVRELVSLVPALTAEGADLATELYARSEGNPLFLRELVADITGASLVSLPEPVVLNSRKRASQSMPLGISSIIRARLARMTPESRSVAEIAAVVGQSFSIEVLCEVTGWPEKQVLDALDELIDLHLVREAATRSRLNHAFTHHLIQTSVYDGIELDVRSRRHRRIARVIEDVYSDRLDDLATDLALHYDRGGEPERAAKHYWSAANHAFRLYANDEALRYASRALALTEDSLLQSALLALREALGGRRGDRSSQLHDLEELDRMARSRADDEMISEVLWRRILVYRALGERDQEARCITELKARADVLAQRRWSASARMADAAHDLLTGRVDDAFTLATDALERHRDLGDAAGQVECLCLLAEIAAFGGSVADSRNLLDEAQSFAQSERNPSLICRATMAMSKAALIAQDFSESEKLARTALQLFRAIGDREGEADALARIAVGSGRRFRIEEARESYAQAATIYAAIGKRLGMAVVLVNSGLLANRVGQLQIGLDAYAEALQHFTALGDVRGQTVCTVNQSLAFLMQGDAASAKVAASRALFLARSIHDRALEAVALGNLGASERELGLIPDALEHMKAALDLRPSAQRPADFLDDLADLALTYLQAGELETARATVDELLAAVGLAGDIHYWPWQKYWVAAQVYHACEQSSAAASALQSAYDLLVDRAESITDTQTRDSFFSLPLNVELLAAHGHGIWPARSLPRNVVVP